MNRQLPSENSVMDNIDPHKMLGLKPGTYDLDDLKKKYMNLARKLHPDKSNGDANLFNLVQLSYDKLKEDLKLKQSDRQFHDLKQGNQDYVTDQTNNPRKNVHLTKMQEEQKKYKNEMSKRKVKSSTNYNFNNFQEAFNQIYEDHRISDPYDKGYGEMMADHSAVREDIDIKRTVKNKKDFHSIFEQESINKNNKKIIAYKDPVALPAQSGILSCYTLGQDKIDDFSSGLDTSGLGFTDYRKAHTTSRLIDPNSVKSRKEYKTVDELQSDRSNMKPLNAKELRQERRKEEKIVRNEQFRQERVQHQDQTNFDFFNGVNKIMLNFKS
jgi:curved DNA-binding protein CbpA